MLDYSPMPKTLYDRVGDISLAVAKFVRDQGTGHSMLLGELPLYGCHCGPMLAGRVLREYGHVVANDLRLVAKVSYDPQAKRIIVDPLLG